MPFAGLQLNEDENREEVIGDFMRTVAKVGSKFKTFKLYGILDLGKYQFLRFETDCNRKYIEYAAKKLGRGFIIPNREGQYIATYPGWSGPAVTAVSMQSVPLPGWQKTFRGPGAPFWERQFK